MSKNTKNPSKPISSDFVGEIHDSQLSVPQNLKEEMRSKGLEWRWISLKDLQRNGGFHRANWKPYKSDSIKSVSSDFGGTGPEGYLVRGEMVLAAKSKEAVEQQRALIRRKTEAQAGYGKQAAQQLRSTLGNKAKVVEGYEDDGE